MEGRPTLSDNLLTAKIKHRLGALSLDVSFALAEPWTVLFGPSGGGKTTVLRAIAGFIRPDAGLIVQGTEVLVDSAARVFVPAHQRPVRSAGQTPRLFPHMSVRRNIAYGVGGSFRPQEGAEIVSEALQLFRLEGLADRMPRDLSGGERQRVSVARAVVSAAAFGGDVAALLLLDEPFAGLDVRLRDELLVELKPWLSHQGVPVLSVTHDVGEAFQLEAEVIRIADGRVALQGPVNEALSEERRRLIDQLHTGECR